MEAEFNCRRKGKSTGNKIVTGFRFEGWEVYLKVGIDIALGNS